MHAEYSNDVIIQLSDIAIYCIFGLIPLISTSQGKLLCCSVSSVFWNSKLYRELQDWKYFVEPHASRLLK